MLHIKPIVPDSFEIIFHALYQSLYNSLFRRVHLLIRFNIIAKELRRNLVIRGIVVVNQCSRPAFCLYSDAAVKFLRPFIFGKCIIREIIDRRTAVIIRFICAPLGAPVSGQISQHGKRKHYKRSRRHQKLYPLSLPLYSHPKNPEHRAYRHCHTKNIKAYLAGQKKQEKKKRRVFPL